MSTTYLSSTIEKQTAELARMRTQGNLERVGDEQSAHFPNGSSIARVSHIPWTPFTLAGSKFKLLAINWKHDMYVFMLTVPGAISVATHYHLSEAYGYIMTGGSAKAFEYEFGNVFAGDFVGEGEDIEHCAVMGDGEVLQVSIIFGGLTGVTPSGGPDLNTYYGCKEIYEAAKANGAADHIAPPPPGWRSSVLEAALKRFPA
jgi:ChrR Cupin-like domain